MQETTHSPITRFPGVDPPIVRMPFRRHSAWNGERVHFNETARAMRNRKISSVDRFTYD
jgi:hypothetical protein